MSFKSDDIAMLRERIKQNERHIEEMEWALLTRGETLPPVPGIDVMEIKLRAENAELNGLIDKLQRPVWG